MAELIIKNLELRRSGRCLIQALEAHLGPTEVVAIVGNNGVGKSTLLHTLAGLLPAPQGSVSINRRDLGLFSRTQRARIISLLLQHSQHQPYCLSKSRIAHGLLPVFGFDHWPDTQTIEWVEQLADGLKIRHLLDRPLQLLSGGEQRLVNIAKCLINPHNELILLDEPSVFLDASQKLNLARVIRQQASTQKIILFSSHDSDFINWCATRELAIRDQSGIFNARRPHNG